MTASTKLGPRPEHPSLDAPAPGQSLIYWVDLEGHEQSDASVALLGPGRDALDRDAFAAKLGESLKALTEAGLHGRCRIGQAHETVTETLADPLAAGRTVRMDRTARRMHHAEQSAADWREANAAWEAEVERIGHEPCDRCGGAGGYRGWPGYTCYECGGIGHTEARS